VSPLPYPLVCALLGVVLGAIPSFVHGPIHQKFDVLYLNGSIIVWAWYTARSLIGYLVGVTRWPRQWWLRGPLCGAIMIVPLCFVSLGTPGCGPPCAAANFTSAVTVGTLVGGIAYLLTRRHSW
jgi:hypothetical protein